MLAISLNWFLVYSLNDQWINDKLIFSYFTESICWKFSWLIFDSIRHSQIVFYLMWLWVHSVCVQLLKQKLCVRYFNDLVLDIFGILPVIKEDTMYYLFFMIKLWFHPISMVLLSGNTHFHHNYFFSRTDVPSIDFWLIV